MYLNALRRLYLVALQHAPGVIEGRRVRGREAARDRRGLVAHHVREQEGYGRGRMGEAYQSPALQDRSVFPYGVDLPYIRPASEEVPRKLLQVRKLARRSRVGEQRRGPTRDEGEQQVSFSQRLRKLLYPAGRLNAPLVRFGMGGEEGLETLGTLFVAVLGDDQSAGEALPEQLPCGPRHRPRSLAGRDNEHVLCAKAPSVGGERSVLRVQRAANCYCRVGGGQAGREDLLQVVPHMGIVTIREPGAALRYAGSGRRVGMRFSANVSILFGGVSLLSASGGRPRPASRRSNSGGLR